MMRSVFAPITSDRGCGKFMLLYTAYLLLHHWSSSVGAQLKNSMCFKAQKSPSSFDLYDVTLFTFAIRKHASIWCSVPMAITHTSAATFSRKCTDPSFSAFLLRGVELPSSKLRLLHLVPFSLYLTLNNIAKSFENILGFLLLFFNLFY